MFEGLLSPGAGALYGALIHDGAIPLHDSRSAGNEMAELLEKGFARRNHRADPDKPVITAVEPARAVDHAILTAQQRVVEQQRAIIAARQELDKVQAAYRAVSDSVDFVEVITDSKRVSALSVELCLSAREEFVSFTTARYPRPPDFRTAMTFPAAVTERGVALRTVYERDALAFDGAAEVVRACGDAGWAMRVAPKLPMKMVVADRHTALVPIDSSAGVGAVCFRTPTVVSALRTLFELVWSQAAPLGDIPANGRTGLTPTQAKVLRLVATGMTDAAIARHLTVSERTVRRHVSSVLEALHADNRVAAVYAATRLGWLS